MSLLLVYKYCILELSDKFFLIVLYNPFNAMLILTYQYFCLHFHQRCRTINLYYFSAHLWCQCQGNAGLFKFGGTPSSSVSEGFQKNLLFKMFASIYWSRNQIFDFSLLTSFGYRFSLLTYLLTLLVRSHNFLFHDLVLVGCLFPGIYPFFSSYAIFLI